MNKVISSLEHITRSKECRVVFNKRGKHIFGGEVENLVIKGLKPLKRIHHIFTINTLDNLTPIRFSECRFLPLIFPLTYEDASFMSYLVTDELEVTVTSISDCTLDDPEYSLNYSLPYRKANLKPLSYAEKRIFHSEISEKSFLDKLRINRLWNGQFFGVSGMMEYNPTFGPCLNKDNSENDTCSSWQFAAFPATNVPFGEIWNDIQSDAIFEFYLCINCNQIHAHLSIT